jgi:hypothetical protein
MGLLGKLFGTEKERAPLDPSSPGWTRMLRHHDVVVAFASKLHDRIEVVPGDRVLYAFIGRPPEAFGIAWFEGGDEHNLKSLMKARGLSQAQVQQISEELRAAYVRSSGEPRFEYLAGKKHVVVTPSASLERALAAIIHEAGAD